jgi:hypothetical protein
MAKKPKKGSAVAQAKAAAAAKKKGGKGAPGLNKMVVLGLIGLLIPFSLPTVILVSVTMLPTLGAYFSEKGNNRYAWLCVGGLNFSGLIPYLFALWFGVHTMDEALTLISDGGVLFWTYFCAAIGWLIYKATPPLVASWMKMSSQRRLASLKAAQRKLVEEWGDDVTMKAQGAAPK